MSRYKGGRRVWATLAFTVASLALPFSLIPQAGDTSRPTVALVLSGGGARGFAHVGVLRVLEELHVPIDMIVGTSMGSIIGGLYCAGYTPAELEQLTCAADWPQLLSDNPPRSAQSLTERLGEGRRIVNVHVARDGSVLSPGLLSGRRVRSLLECLVLDASEIVDFSRLRPAFCAVATDIETGRERRFQSGDLATVMRASMSTPGIFDPVRIGDGIYVDGGVLNDLPVNVAIDLGADIVIAVDITTPFPDHRPPEDPITVLHRMMKSSMIQSTLRNRNRATVLITPELDQSSFSDFCDAPAIIAEGERAARLASVPLARIAEEAKGGETLRQSPGPNPVHFDRIRIAGEPSIGERDFARLLYTLDPAAGLSVAGGSSTGPRARAMSLYRAAQMLMATGRYDDVRYALSREATGGRDLLVTLVPAVSNLVSVDAGGWYQYTFSRDPRSAGMFYGAVTLSPATGSNLLAQFQTGTEVSFDTCFVQMLGPTFYLAPSLEYFAARSALNLCFESGYRPGGSLRAAIRYAAGLTPTGLDESGFDLEIESDTRDSLPLPATGHFLAANYAVRSTVLGGSRSYGKVVLNGRWYGTIADRHTFVAGFSAGTVLNTLFSSTSAIGSFADQYFPIDWKVVPAYLPDSLSAASYLTLGSGYRWRIAGSPQSVPVELPLGLFAHAHGGAGLFWNGDRPFSLSYRLLAGADIGLTALLPGLTVTFELGTSLQERMLMRISCGSYLR